MKYKEQNDYELLYMVRESNDEIKDILYEKYYPVIKNISKEFYDKYNCYGYDYDDFLQEAILSFEKSIIYYDQNTDNLFYTFVIICMRRSLLSFCRKITSKRNSLPEFYYSTLDEEKISNNYNDLTDVMLKKEIEEDLKKLILELPMEYSPIIELRMNGFNYREIGVLLELPISSVEYRIRKIRKRAKLKYNKTI